MLIFKYSNLNIFLYPSEEILKNGLKTKQQKSLGIFMEEYGQKRSSEQEKWIL